MRYCKGPWAVVAMTQLSAAAKVSLKSSQNIVNPTTAAFISQHHLNKAPALAHQAYAIVKQVLPDPAFYLSA